MNIWLGPQERQYVKARQDFAGCLDRDVKMVPVTGSLPSDVRVWALVSKRRAAAYLHHFRDHDGDAGSDTEEREAGTAPLNRLNFPTK